MSFFTQHVKDVATENELTEVLSHYDSEFVLSIVTEAMKARYSIVPILEAPNVVGAWEQNFKAILAQYGEGYRVEIEEVRSATYKSIIDAICMEFGLAFTIDQDIELFAAAYNLYNFFVCNFSQNLVSYFAQTIYNNKSAMYDGMELAEMKKNKDSSTLYAKKVYKDIKLAVINANIDKVITEMCDTMEPGLYDIIALVGQPKDIVNYFITIVADRSRSFFNTAYGAVLKSDMRPSLISNIQIRLQEIAMAHDQINDNPISDGE